MIAKRISLEQTGHFSKLFLDYINQKEELSPFYKYSPDLNSFEQAAKDISPLTFNRKLLAEVITEQYAGCPGYPESAIRQLLDEKTFTVCTGHQLCLFTGPMYFIYKIISTIKLAEELNLKSQISNLKSVFVPVFWMASEDHDFEEVNHVNISGHKIEWRNKKGGAVGRYSTRGIEAVLNELKDAIGDSSNANELLKIFRDAYVNHPNMAAATRYLVNELFGRYGLVIIDADDKRLKNEFKEIIRDDLFNHTGFKLVNETADMLKRSGYDVQVLPREINYFLLSKNFRARIDAEKVRSEPAAWSRKIETEIERFSPNVVARPLYQQKILPNIAYIGGPAEIAYWLEYRSMFEQYKIFFPALIPRNFVHISLKTESELEIFGSELQERHDNFIPCYLKYGKSFFDSLKNSLDPLDFRFTILSEKE